MFENKKITALVAVKGNSERVPKKNIRPFHNSSLLEIKLEQICAAKVFDEIIVSSESDEVLSKCKNFNVSPHKRNPIFSQPLTPMSDVYEHLASQVNTEYIAWIPVTNPMVNELIYKDAVKTFHEMDNLKYDSLLSVHELHEYLYYNEKPLNFSRDPWIRSQDLTGVYAINFAINILSKASMIKNRATLGERPNFFVIQHELAIDIDYMRDFLLAEIIYKQKLEESK